MLRTFWNRDQPSHAYFLGGRLRQGSNAILSIGFDRTKMLDVELRLDVELVFPALQVLCSAELHRTFGNKKIDISGCAALFEQSALDLDEVDSTNNWQPGLQCGRDRELLGIHRGDELRGWFT